VRCGWRNLGKWPGGVWFCDLTEARDITGIASAVAGSLGVVLEQGDPIEELGHAIAGRGRCLVILDNFEQIVEQAGVTLSRWLTIAVEARFLVTSRALLSVDGETVQNVGQMSPEQGLELFTARARWLRPSLELEGTEAESAREIVRLVERMPLAIELAAARIRVMSVSQIVGQMRKRFQLLTGGPSNRHETLTAVIDDSWELLTPALKRFLSHLSVFRGGWTVSAAEAVCKEPLAMDYLSQLARWSLLFPDPTASGELRFRMLEFVRESVARHLNSRDEALARARHLDYFQQLAEMLAPELTGPQQLLGFERAEADLDNFVSAMDSSVAEEDRIEAQLSIGASLGRFWDVRHVARGLALLTSVLGRDAAPTRARAYAFRNAGLLALDMSKYTEALSYAERSVSIYRDLGDRKELAGSLNNLGLVLRRQGRHAVALSKIEEALAINREVGNRNGEADNLGNLGLLALDMRDFPLARSYLEAALALDVELGNRRGYAMTLLDLGNLALYEDDYASAWGMIERSLAIFRELGDKFEAEIAMESLVDLDIARANYAGARVQLIETLHEIKKLNIFHGDFALRLAARIVHEMKGGAPNSPVNRVAEAQATRLYAAAETVRKAIGTPTLQEWKHEHERRVVQLRDALGEQAFHAAWEEGRAMSYQEAIDYALAEL
jgi:predicted ATPase